MISNAWFTVNYFHVSFGKQDLIQQAIQAINETEKIPIDEKHNWFSKNFQPHQTRKPKGNFGISIEMFLTGF